MQKLIRSRFDYLAVVPAALLLFGLVAIVAPPSSGPLALALVLEAHLFIAAFVVLLPFAVFALARARARVLPISLAVLVVAGGCFFGSDWVSLPGSGAARTDLTVMTWNLQFGSRTPAETAAQIETANVDVIALQELEPDAAAAIEADPAIMARYPYRAMAPDWRASGLGVLSRYPLRDVQDGRGPGLLRLRVVVDTPSGSVRVIDAHPLPGEVDIVTPLGLPIGFDPSRRDAAIGAMREWVDEALAGGDRLLVLGDFNTSPTEAEYSVLTRGLRDTHVEVGEGPGWTWRPSRLTFLPLAFLRIDLQLSAGAIHPASTSVDCQYQGDHCRLFGSYEID